MLRHYYIDCRIRYFRCCLWMRRFVRTIKRMPLKSGYKVVLACIFYPRSFALAWYLFWSGILILTASLMAM